MIPLDSNKWNKLNHAYGSADDIPELLKAVYSNPYSQNHSESSDFWFKLWSALCHQGDVYSGSIAAVPHLVRAGLNATEGVLAFDLIQLPVSIELSRMARPHQVALEYIDDDYWSSILDLASLCDIASQHGEDKNLMDSVRAATKLLRGRHGSNLPPQKTEISPGDLFTTQTN